MIFKEMTKLLGAFISGYDDKSKENGQASLQTLAQDENKAAELEAAELAKYETRRQEIADSSEQINGIFCIYAEEIIPDYFSEYLVSDKDSPKEKERYHSHFYKNYIKRKYPGLLLSDTHLPRGRVNSVPNRTDVFIDKCYFRNVAIINQLRELYRITGQIYVLWNSNYKCHTCLNTNDSEKPFQSYFLGEPYE